MLCSDVWPAEVTPIDSIDVRGTQGQYAIFEKYIQSMRGQPGAAELILGTVAGDKGCTVLNVLKQLDHLKGVN